MTKLKDREPTHEELQKRIEDLKAERASLRAECAARGEQIVALDREFRALAQHMGPGG